MTKKLNIACIREGKKALEVYGIEETSNGTLWKNGTPLVNKLATLSALNITEEEFQAEYARKNWDLFVQADTVARMGVNPAGLEVITLDEYKRREDEREAAEMREKQAPYITACPEGYEPCERNWSNGDLMSAEYEALDGTKILGSDLIECQGMGIYYMPKVDLDNQRRKNAERKAKEEESEANEKARINAAFAKAKATGKRVVIRTWTEIRKGDYEGVGVGEYQFSCAEYAMPDGTTTRSAMNMY